MAAFTVRREADVPAAVLWDVVTDFGAYGRWLPLTTMRHDPGPPRPGWSFVGLTGLGPARFADPMTVERWEPAPEGGLFAVRKHGAFLAGWAQVEVTRREPGRTSALTWTEEITLRPARLGLLLAPVSRRLGRRLFSAAIDRMVAAAQDRAA